MLVLFDPIVKVNEQVLCGTVWHYSRNRASDFLVGSQGGSVRLFRLHLIQTGFLLCHKKQKHIQHQPDLLSTRRKITKNFSDTVNIWSVD